MRPGTSSTVDSLVADGALTARSPLQPAMREAGILVERATGRRSSAGMQKRVLDPAGVRVTSFHVRGRALLLPFFPRVQARTWAFLSVFPLPVGIGRRIQPGVERVLRQPRCPVFRGQAWHRLHASGVIQAGREAGTAARNLAMKQSASPAGGVSGDHSSPGRCARFQRLPASPLSYVMPPGYASVSTCSRPFLRACAVDSRRSL